MGIEGLEVGYNFLYKGSNTFLMLPFNKFFIVDKKNQEIYR